MKSVLGAVAASCFVAVAILLLSWTSYFAELNSTAYDFALRLAGPVRPSSPVVIVAIDEDSLDGISRRIFSAKAGEGRVVPAFAVQALHAAGLEFQADFEEKAGIAERIRPQTVNIRFTGDENTFRRVPAWRVLEGSADVGQFRDQIILIGFTAEGLGDEWFTPFAITGKKMSGVEVHANVIDTLYAGRAIGEVPELVLLAALAAFVFLLWWLNHRFEGWRFYAAAIATGPLVLALCWFLMKHFHLWLSFPPFWAAIVFVLPGLEVANRVRVSRDLDKKIERLSSGWIAALTSFQSQTQAADERRNRLFGRRRHNSRWKLDAIDFFNQELMQFLSFNNAILASINDVIIVSDLGGRVVYQNPAGKALQNYQMNPADAPSYIASILDGRNLRPEFESVLANTESVTVNFIPTRDGRRFYNVSILPIARSGVVVTMHDATAQYELNQAKSDMVSLVSHELRTPLTSIRGYSDMLLKYDLVHDKGKTFLGTIIDESNRLNQLIQSFLDIAYIESGRHGITKSDFEVAPMLKDMVNTVGPVAAGKQITIQSAGAGGVRVHADRLLVYQALTKLVAHAIKYSPAGAKKKDCGNQSAGPRRF